jgi:phospholipid N-methyltransferase
LMGSAFIAIIGAFPLKRLPVTCHMAVLEDLNSRITA